jgi:purine-binding chemotaxis protein CheW
MMTIGETGGTAAAMERTEKYLTFRLADEEYGIGILGVQEIVSWMDITRIPRTPEFIRGVINLRGRVIPVLDLRARFGLPPQAQTPQTCIVVLQVRRDGGRITVGAIVDEVTEVLDLAPSQIDPVPEMGLAVDTAFLAGIGKSGQRVIILLEVARLLATRDWISVEQSAHHNEKKETTHE